MSAKKKKSPTSLVFGEDDSDRQAIRELVQALRPDLPPPEKRRRPLVLVKGRAAAEQRKSACEIGRVVQADAVKHDVVAVFAHEDADAVEPAHEPHASAIESNLAAVMVVPVVAVVPAWEIEAWWFLWPDAVAAVNARWARLTHTGAVGRIEHAKEALRRALRPKSKGKPPRDFEESDGPRVAAKVRQLALVSSPVATSDSWDRFQRRVLAL